MFAPNAAARQRECRRALRNGNSSRFAAMRRSCPQRAAVRERQPRATPSTLNTARATQISA